MLPRKTLYHEAAHCAVARRLGATVQDVIVRKDGSGVVHYAWQPLPPPSVRAAVFLAGAVAEAKCAGERKVYPYLVGEDLRQVCQLAESAGCRSRKQVTQFIRGARKQATAILSYPPAWSAVESLAAQIEQAGGKLVYETATVSPVVPPARPLTFRQQPDAVRRAAAVLWGAAYP